MKQKAFTLYDSKSKVYAKPFFVINEAVALRAISDLLTDMNTEPAKHPEDFILFAIGEYDDTTGEFVPEVPRAITKLCDFNPELSMAEMQEVKR